VLIYVLLVSVVVNCSIVLYVILVVVNNKLYMRKNCIAMSIISNIIKSTIYVGTIPNTEKSSSILKGYLPNGHDFQYKRYRTSTTNFLFFAFCFNKLVTHKVKK